MGCWINEFMLSIEAIDFVVGLQNFDELVEFLKVVATPFSLPLAFGGAHKAEFNRSAGRRMSHRTFRRFMAAGK